MTYINSLNRTDGSSTSTTSPKKIQPKGNSTIGVTATPLGLNKETESIIIQSAEANTGVVYIGDSTVANDGTSHIAYISAGDVCTMDYTSSASQLYIISDTAAQTVSVGATLL